MEIGDNNWEKLSFLSRDRYSTPDKSLKLIFERMDKEVELCMKYYHSDISFVYKCIIKWLDLGECEIGLDWNYIKDNIEELTKYGCNCRDLSRIMMKEYNIPNSTWNWITLSPRPFLDYTKENQDKLVEFCEKIFIDINFNKCKWVIECGKHEDNPNLHIHALCNFSNDKVSKNFKRSVCALFKRMFKPSVIDWKNSGGVGYHNVVIRKHNNKLYDTMLKDKMDYMDNSEKGCHENFLDLGLKGGV